MRTLTFVALMTAALAAAPARADMVTAILDPGTARVVTIDSSAGRQTVYAGAFSVSLDGRTPVQGFCVDLLHENTINDTYGVTEAPGGVGLMPDSGFPDAAIRIADVLYRYAIGDDPDGLAALQMAIWYYADRNFGIVSAPGQVVSYFRSLVGFTGDLPEPIDRGNARFLAADHVGNRFQDLVVPAPVPEPRAIVSALVGLVALAFLKVWMPRRKEVVR